MNVHRINFIIVDNRTQSGAGKSDFSMRIFFLQKPSVHSCGKGIFSKVVQPKSAPKPTPLIPPFKALPERKNDKGISFYALQDEVFRIYQSYRSPEKQSHNQLRTYADKHTHLRLQDRFKTNHSEIFSGNFTCFSYVFYGGFTPAFSCQN